jgi:hypothetical protein
LCHVVKCQEVLEERLIMPKFTSALRSPTEIGIIFNNVLRDQRFETAELRRYFLMLICMPITESDLLQLHWQNMSSDKKLIVFNKRHAGTFAFTQAIYPAPHFLQNSWRQSSSFGPLFPKLLAMQPKLRKNLLKTYLKELWPHFDIKVDDFRKFFRVYATAKSSYKPKFINMIMAGSIGKLEHPIHFDSGVNLLDWWVMSLGG